MKNLVVIDIQKDFVESGYIKKNNMFSAGMDNHNIASFPTHCIAATPLVNKDITKL